LSVQSLILVLVLSTVHINRLTSPLPYIKSDLWACPSLSECPSHSTPPLATLFVCIQWSLQDQDVSFHCSKPCPNCSSVTSLRLFLCSLFFSSAILLPTRVGKSTHHLTSTVACDRASPLTSPQLLESGDSSGDSLEGFTEDVCAGNTFAPSFTAAGIHVTKEAFSNKAKAL